MSQYIIRKWKALYSDITTQILPDQSLAVPCPGKAGATNEWCIMYRVVFFHIDRVIFHE